MKKPIGISLSKCIGGSSEINFCEKNSAFTYPCIAFRNFFRFCKMDDGIFFGVL